MKLLLHNVPSTESISSTVPANITLLFWLAVRRSQQIWATWGSLKSWLKGWSPTISLPCRWNWTRWRCWSLWTVLRWQHRSCLRWAEPSTSGRASLWWLGWNLSSSIICLSRTLRANLRMELQSKKVVKRRREKGKSWQTRRKKKRRRAAHGICEILYI